MGCTKKKKKKYSRKQQSPGSNLFRPKPATLTLILCSRWHWPPSSSKICVKHTSDKPQISQNCFFSYMLMAFIAPPIGWAQHAFVGRLPVQSWAYPPSFVMTGQRVWELWPIIHKPRLLKFVVEMCLPLPRSGIPNLVLIESIFQKFYSFYCFSHYANWQKI